MLVFKVKDLPQMPKGKGNKILNVPTAKFTKGEEAVAGVAVFGVGQAPGGAYVQGRLGCFARGA